MQAISVNIFEAGYLADIQRGRPSKRQRPPFGERLRALREAAGLSQQQVADKLGMTQTAYAWWERNPVALRPDQLQKLSATLNVSVDELMGTAQNKRRGTGPVGKLRQVFDQANQLPRHQQAKVVEFLENFLRGMNNKPA